MRRVCTTWVAIAVLATSAHAQEPVERAREQYRVGVELAREQNWVEAEAAFQRAYAFYPEPLIIFNLASVRSQLGRYIDARNGYREFLERATEAQSSYIEAAREQLAEVEAKIGTIDIEVTGFEDGDIVQLDGRAVEQGPNEADPGDHVVTVRRGTARVARTRITLGEGAREAATLVVINPERVVVVEQERSRGPLIGGLVTAALLLAGGALTTALILRNRGDDPHQGNVPPGVIELPLR